MAATETTAKWCQCGASHPGPGTVRWSRVFDRRIVRSRLRIPLVGTRTYATPHPASRATVTAGRLLVLGLVLTVAIGSLSRAAVISPTTAARGTIELRQLLPPPWGKTYFGFIFRLWDTTDPRWGDTRSFRQRINDSIEMELGGKHPTTLEVDAPWQDSNGRSVPFVASRADVAKVLRVTGTHG